MYTILFKFLGDDFTYHYSTDNIEAYNDVKERIVNSINSFVVDEIKEIKYIDLLEKVK